MSDNEVNKIITEFMGWNLWSGQFSGIRYNAEIYIDENGKKVLNNFTESLDALVPVWEKLKVTDFQYNIAYDNDVIVYDCEITATNGEYLVYVIGVESMKTIQQAAAHTTARAILESKE